MRQPVLMFDFGNVISFFDYSVMLGRFGRRLGKTPEQLAILMHESGAAELGREFERGRLTAQEFTNEVMKRAGLKMTLEEFEADWVDIFTLNEPVARLVKALKTKGYSLLLGSNTNVLHANFFRRKFRETLAHFDHMVLSYEIGRVKPDKLFFAACLETAGAPAESCIFIDDTPINVEGAQSAGLQALLYRDPLELVADLRRLGVQIPDLKT